MTSGWLEAAYACARARVCVCVFVFVFVCACWHACVFIGMPTCTPPTPFPARAPRDIAQGILERSGIPAGSGYQLGVSKVFLRAGHMAVLDKQRTGELPARPLCAALADGLQQTLRSFVFIMAAGGCRGFRGGRVRLAFWGCLDGRRGFQLGLVAAC